MKTIRHIGIVYNLNSTGDAADIAKKLYDWLRERGKTPQLLETGHAGHAVELTREFASKHSNVLVISVSGDGGYHEVVNGAMQLPISKRPVVAVAGAGNANDHRRVARRNSLRELIQNQSIKPLDLLKISVSAEGYKYERYAHSYIGLGLTAEAGHVINIHSKGIFREIFHVLRALGSFSPFDIEQDGIRTKLDSLVFANINEIAKFIKLHKQANLTDGRFEIVRTEHVSRVRTFYELLRIIMTGNVEEKSTLRRKECVSFGCGPILVNRRH